MDAAKIGMNRRTAGIILWLSFAKKLQCNKFSSNCNKYQFLKKNFRAVSQVRNWRNIIFCLWGVCWNSPCSILRNTRQMRNPPCRLFRRYSDLSRKAICLPFPALCGGWFPPETTRLRTWPCGTGGHGTYTVLHLCLPLKCRDCPSACPIRYRISA